MSKWQPIWLALCFAITYAANRGLAPSVVYEMGLATRTMPTGALKLEVAGRTHELKLATVVVVSDELRPLLADPKPVRVLWMRAVEDGKGGDPDMELFVDVLGVGSAPDVSGGGFGGLRDQTLSVLDAAPGGAARSRVRLPGDSAPRLVRAGTVHVARVLALEAGAEGARSRVEGTVHLSIEREGGEAEAVRGSFDARIGR